uniref:Cullin N-terminal domain-containing protein n=1 Tax=Glossina palpalis gambiensis TaxID=67801 RepID=A0A1B0AYS6_9MUSC
MVLRIFESQFFDVNHNVPGIYHIVARQHGDHSYVQTRDVENVHNLDLILFRDEIVRYSDIQKPLLGTLLDTVIDERSGVAINALAIKNASRTLITLGINSRPVCGNDFEKSFLTRSAASYSHRYF